MNWLSLFVLVLTVASAYGIWQIFFQNQFNVEPGRRERLVIQNNQGDLDVLGPGRHFCGPGWFKFVEVSINRDPIVVTGQTVKCSNGPVLLTDFRYDILHGRPFNINNGVLTVIDPDNDTEVKPDLIKQTVIRINDFSAKHREYVAQIVSAAVETTFADYTDAALMTPGKQPNPQVPTQAIIDREIVVDHPGQPARRWMVDPAQLIQPRLIGTAAELYDQLSRLIELKVNFGLRHLGINILSFRITDLVYRDAQVQQALEMGARLERLRQALPAGSDLTDAELLAAGTDQLGITSLGQGIRKAGLAVGEGLRNFGRG